MKLGPVNNIVNVGVPGTLNSVVLLPRLKKTVVVDVHNISRYLGFGTCIFA